MCDYIDLDAKIYESIHSGLTRDKNKDDTVSEPSDMTEMFIDPNAFTHPSLTVTFTLKVRLHSLFAFICFKEIRLNSLVENNSSDLCPSFGIRLFVTHLGSWPAVT